MICIGCLGLYLAHSMNLLICIAGIVWGILLRPQDTYDGKHCSVEQHDLVHFQGRRKQISDGQAMAGNETIASMPKLD